MKAKFAMLAVWGMMFAVSLSSPGADQLIGVLAKRGDAKAEQRWAPLADYLTQHIPGYSFRIITLRFDEIANALKMSQVDFLLVNSGIYAENEAEFHLKCIATLRNKCGEQSTTQFGGVLFTLASREDVRTITDLKGGTFAAVDETSFGGWIMVWREMKHAGFDPRHDLASLRFLGTHDAVVRAVLAKQVDAGAVRSDTLERMAVEGTIHLSDLRLLETPSAADERKKPEHFPYRCNTAYYPEWPFIKMPHVSDTLAKDVAAALLAMPAGGSTATACQSAGWVAPLDYKPVHDAYRELELGPYRKSDPDEEPDSSLDRSP
ncbi:MAG: phosphate/phosphite/phosphonate ABC transporter substrate-binding protein [Phycisphaerales bacterium]